MTTLMLALIFLALCVIASKLDAIAAALRGVPRSATSDVERRTRH